MRRELVDMHADVSDCAANIRETPRKLQHVMNKCEDNRFPKSLVGFGPPWTQKYAAIRMFTILQFRSPKLFSPILVGEPALGSPTKFGRKKFEGIGSPFFLLFLFGSPQLLEFGRLQKISNEARHEEL